MAMDPNIQAGIFEGESGGDYNALFGFSNRPGKQFANTNLQGMTVDQAIEFANPKGPYAQWVKGQIGRVATPMGAYQIVGDTLKLAKRWAGLRGDELMTKDIQDKLGEAVLAAQGTGAWAGYKGPKKAGGLRHVGGAGSSSEYFAPKTTTSGGGGGGGQYTLTPEKPKPKQTTREHAAEAMGNLLEGAESGGMGEAPRMPPVEFSGGQPMPSVLRAPFQPIQAPMPGGDLRALLAQLMGAQGGGPRA